MNAKTIFLSALLTLLPLSVTANDELPSGAQTTIDTYFSGMQQGDLAALGSVLDGQMKKRHDRASRNPNYAAALSASYAATTFSVLQSKIEASMLTVDYQATNGDEVFRKQIYLRDSVAGFKIIGESLIP